MQIWGIHPKPTKMELLGMKLNSFHFLQKFFLLILTASLVPYCGLGYGATVARKSPFGLALLGRPSRAPVVFELFRVPD